MKKLLLGLGLCLGLLQNVCFSEPKIWVFSGLVVNERGDYYGYLFEMQKHQQEFHVETALFEAQTQKVILHEVATATLTPEEAKSTTWHVGPAFMQFNTINQTWVLGVKTKDKKGFNFKVDTLKAVEEPLSQLSKSIQLSNDIAMKVVQTNTLNGHIHIGYDQEEFVTAKSTWMRKMGFKQGLEISYPMQNLLCQFEDGSGFYSMHLKDSKAYCGAVTGRLDAQGHRQKMSQFLNIREEGQGRWNINAQAPKLHWVIENLLAQESTLRVAGFTAQKDQIGFCTINLG